MTAVALGTGDRQRERNADTVVAQYPVRVGKIAERLEDSGSLRGVVAERDAVSEPAPGCPWRRCGCSRGGGRILEPDRVRDELAPVGDQHEAARMSGFVEQRVVHVEDESARASGEAVVVTVSRPRGRRRGRSCRSARGPGVSSGDARRSRLQACQGGPLRPLDEKHDALQMGRRSPVPGVAGQDEPLAGLQRAHDERPARDHIRRMEAGEGGHPAVALGDVGRDQVREQTLPVRVRALETTVTVLPPLLPDDRLMSR